MVITAGMYMKIITSDRRPTVVAAVVGTTGMKTRFAALNGE